jgi:hypothetical protein
MMDEEETRDAELVALARSGSKEAFGRLVERYQDMAYHIALGMVPSEDIARELARGSAPGLPLARSSARRRSF